MKSKKYFPLLVIGLLSTSGLFTSSIFAQETAPAVTEEATAPEAVEEEAPMTFQSASGTTYQAGKNTELEILDPLSNNATVILTPKQGSSSAEVVITDGEKQTVLTAQKITFHTETESFTLDGSSKIVQGKDSMIGPGGITFDSAKNTMIARGNGKQPAKCTFVKKDGTPFNTEAGELHFFFENVNGDRVLKRFKTVQNNSSVFFRSKSDGKKSGGSPMPKLSPQR